MPRRRQPSSLLTQCVRVVARRIVAKSTALYKRSLRRTTPAILEFAPQESFSDLPGTVRALLLEEIGRALAVPPPTSSIVTTQPGRSGVLFNFAAAMLFGSVVPHLHVKLCCNKVCSHVKALLSLLAQEGAGLKTLDLALPPLKALEPALLQQALIRPVNLKHLYLQRNCRDAYLKIIGSACTNVTILDISKSKYVTDQGLRFLFLREEVPLMEGRDTHLCLDASCGNVECKLVRLLLNLFSWMQCSGEGNEVAAGLRHILQCWKRETKLCGSLRTLDIGETSVTSHGAVFALMKTPLLRSLGTYMNLGGALEAFDSCWGDVYRNSAVDLPTFGLHSVLTLHITEPQLVLLNKYIPSLDFLSVSHPQFDPRSLKLLTPTLNTLNIDKFEFEGLWAAEIYSLGNKLPGRILESLSLSSFSSDEGIELNVHDVFQSCPNLRTFRVTGINMHWAQAESGSGVTMPYLRFLKMGNSVPRNVVVEALKRCPNLEVAHFYRCPDLIDGDIIDATYPSSQHLKCFYVYQAPFLTVRSLSFMHSTYENLSSIGVIDHWDISLSDTLSIKSEILEDNWDLELKNFSHWFDFDKMSH